MRACRREIAVEAATDVGVCVGDHVGVFAVDLDPVALVQITVGVAPFPIRGVRAIWCGPVDRDLDVAQCTRTHASVA